MASTLTNLIYHVVFSTKNRVNLILPELECPLYKYIGGIIRGERGRLLTIGGTENHIHILARFRQSITVSDMLRCIKSNSSKWANEENILRGKFKWQRSYAAFTVSPSNIAIVSKYIERQKEHHQKVTFQQEFLLLLKKHGVEYDERYIWD